jgi:hypothetical protein
MLKIRMMNLFTLRMKLKSTKKEMQLIKTRKLIKRMILNLLIKLIKVQLKMKKRKVI